MIDRVGVVRHNGPEVYEPSERSCSRQSAELVRGVRERWRTQHERIVPSPSVGEISATPVLTRCIGAFQAKVDWPERLLCGVPFNRLSQLDLEGRIPNLLLDGLS